MITAPTYSNVWGWGCRVWRLAKQKDNPPPQWLVGGVDECSGRKRTGHGGVWQPQLGGWGNPSRRKVGFKLRLRSIWLDWVVIPHCVSNGVMSILCVCDLFPLFWNVCLSLSCFCIGLSDFFLMGLLRIIYIFCMRAFCQWWFLINRSSWFLQWKIFYWIVTYIQKSTQIISVQLSELSKSEHFLVMSI